MRLGAAQCGMVNFTFESGAFNRLSQLFVSNLLPHFAPTPFQFDAAGVKTSNMAEHVRTERPGGTCRKNGKILFMADWADSTGGGPRARLFHLTFWL